MLWWLFLLVPISYLIGGFNSARSITQGIAKIDIEKIGSGNPGSTNVGRAMGLKWFFVVMLMDMAKGALVALIGLLFCGFYEQNVWTLAQYESVEGLIIMLSMGLSAMLGTMYPVWYKFKGGKGVATWIGISFFINPYVMLITVGIFVPLLLITRMMSLTVLLGITFWAITSVFTSQRYKSLFNPDAPLISVPVLAVIILLYLGFMCLIFFSHRKNIRRLFRREEKEIQFRKTDWKPGDKIDEAEVPPSEEASNG